MLTYNPVANLQLQSQLQPQLIPNQFNNNPIYPLVNISGGGGGGVFPFMPN